MIVIDWIKWLQLLLAIKFNVRPFFLNLKFESATAVEWIHYLSETNEQTTHGHHHQKEEINVKRVKVNNETSILQLAVWSTRQNRRSKHLGLLLHQSKSPSVYFFLKHQKCNILIRRRPVTLYLAESSSERMLNTHATNVVNKTKFEIKQNRMKYKRKIIKINLKARQCVSAFSVATAPAHVSLLYAWCS